MHSRINLYRMTYSYKRMRSQNSHAPDPTRHTQLGDCIQFLHFIKWNATTCAQNVGQTNEYLCIADRCKILTGARVPGTHMHKQSADWRRRVSQPFREKSAFCLKSNNVPAFVLVSEECCREQKKKISSHWHRTRMRKVMHVPEYLRDAKVKCINKKIGLSDDDRFRCLFRLLRTELFRNDTTV